MKPSLAQSALYAEQRLAGAIIGAAIATLFLLTIDNKHVLEVAIVIFGVIAASIRGVNYALYWRRGRCRGPHRDGRRSRPTWPTRDGVYCSPSSASASPLSSCSSPT